MELSLETANHPTLILECVSDGLRFSSGIIRRPIIIHYQCEHIAAHDGLPASAGALGVGHFDFLAQHPFEILVLGTGADTIWMPAPVSAHIQSLGIGVEAARTRQACYVFNVLLSEGRRVAALMYPPNLQA
ncbi:MAG: Mth938-like domain-containing protein [Gammaproteobacteria bacterium]|nr:Mth938-like domain-containing protein [Gammaproteobacteria bacterium]